MHKLDDSFYELFLRSDPFFLLENNSHLVYFNPPIYFKANIISALL